MFVLTSLCAQIATVVMASGSAPRGSSDQWNKDETAALLTYLEEHKSEIGDGGMFKMGTSMQPPARLQNIIIWVQ